MSGGSKGQDFFCSSKPNTVTGFFQLLGLLVPISSQLQAIFPLLWALGDGPLWTTSPRSPCNWLPGLAHGSHVEEVSHCEQGPVRVFLLPSSCSLSALVLCLALGEAPMARASTRRPLFHISVFTRPQLNYHPLPEPPSGKGFPLLLVPGSFTNPACSRSPAHTSVIVPKLTGVNSVFWPSDAIILSSEFDSLNFKNYMTFPSSWWVWMLRI